MAMGLGDTSATAVAGPADVSASSSWSMSRCSGKGDECAVISLGRTGSAPFGVRESKALAPMDLACSSGPWSAQGFSWTVKGEVRLVRVEVL